MEDRSIEKTLIAAACLIIALLLFSVGYSKHAHNRAYLDCVAEMKDKSAAEIRTVCS